ncbi:putative autophagy protein Apg17 [Lyophyllum shimeji]|uniref:Autophagy-related protein 17 n=1 Tax=Lyophyllum shimeji TaxID=47721 RepID=A0A9P3UPB2_LYOSH|nr:putative autophagy protein Apg17 [Lyophyllum shimeji]
MPPCNASDLTPPSTRMSSSSPTEPHLVALVLQSKKALQNGEQLCSRAHAVSNASATTSVDVVALDAKVRWVTEAVAEQLRLVASVARTIDEKRAYLQKQVQEWDKLRAKHSDALDTILESLGSQLVPPDFHESASADSSLFGSQHSDDDQQRRNGVGTGGAERSKPNGTTLSAVSHSPSSTLRSGLQNGHGIKQKGEQEKSPSDESKRSWKTLRDFVDEQAIEDVLETMENDRLGLDYIMSKTDEYPETLANTIASIRESLPELSPDPPTKLIEETLGAQDVTITSMAAHLESLTSHYGQMANALQDSEAGEEFSEEDLHDMNRDTNELPSIMAELEESADAIEEHHEKLQAAKEASQTSLSLLSHTLDDLDELGDIMLEMLQTQDEVETKCEEELSGLQSHLLTIEHLRNRYVSYQTAFNKLILELARRRQYREAAENIVRGMMAQLEAMTEEETQVRNHFNSEYGAHLPEDICLCVGNAPTRWEVVPWNGDTLEFLPVIDNELIAQARERLNAEKEGVQGVLGAESL